MTVPYSSSRASYQKSLTKDFPFIVGMQTGLLFETRVAQIHLAIRLARRIQERLKLIVVL